MVETDDGVSLGQVNPGGPAARAGLQDGDVVLEIGGEAVESASDVQSAVSSRKPGDELRVTVRRGDDQRTVTVTLGTRPASAE
jgi:S1-C subfamily serine protease